MVEWNRPLDGVMQYIVWWMLVSGLSHQSELIS